MNIMWRRRNHQKKYTNPFKMPERRKRSFFLWFWCFLLFIFLAGIFGFLLIFAPFWQIKTIKVTGTYPLAPEKIQKTIGELLSEKHFFPADNLLFFSKNNLIKILQKQYPIDKAVVKKNFSERGIEVQLSGRPYVGYWLTRGLAFKIDKNGVLGSLADDYDSLADGFKVYDLDNQIQPAVNAMALNKPIMDFLLAFYDLKAQGTNYSYKPDYWESSLSRQQLNLMTKSGWRALFNYQDDLKKQIQSLERVLKQAIPVSDQSKLDYINLRFGEKVVYKLR